MKKDDIYPSKNLKVSDIGPGLTLTITKIGREEFKKQETGEVEAKAVAYFAETKKRLIVGKTNFDLIADVTGEDDSDGWIGKRIRLVVETVEAFGKDVEAIRVEKPPKVKVKSKNA